MTAVSKAARAKASKPASIHAHRFALAVSDLILGLAEWRTWWVLAFNDIRSSAVRATYTASSVPMRDIAAMPTLRKRRVGIASLELAKLTAGVVGP
jgi:hypothetical protein